MSSRYLALLGAVDRLYEGVVSDPDAWNEAGFEDWAGEAVAGVGRPSRPLLREVRRCLRAAMKLRDFWANPPEGVPSDAGDWRTRVDLALGIRAWRPALEIAREGLESEPDPEIFDEVARRFREVHGTEWMGGITYDAWERDRSGG